MNMMNQLSKRLQKVFEAAKAWPMDRQEAAAEILEKLDWLENEPYDLSDEEVAEIEEILEEMRRGEIATDEEVAAVFARYGA